MRRFARLTYERFAVAIGVQLGDRPAVRIPVGLCAVALASVASADTYHVAANGSDDSAGSEAAPWRTIQRAADAVRAGDSVVIHAGTYVGFKVTTSGTAEQPITFRADGDVIVDGAMTIARDAVWIEGASWIVVEGLTVTNAQRAGIAALDCANITIRGNKLDRNGRWGVFSGFCDDLVVENNEASRSGTEHGIYASNSADRPIIRGNKIWGNAACGIHMNGDISVPGGDGVISGAIVENNVIRDNGRLGGSAINGDGVTGALIRNNVIDGNHASGISLYRIDGGAPSTGNRIVNNTVRVASDGRWAINIQDASTGNIVRNNVLLNANAGRGAISVCSECMTDMIVDHNAVVGMFDVGGSFLDLAEWRERAKDASSFVATDADLFVDAAAGNLALRDGSPAIDAGSREDAPELDAAGRKRDGSVDIGAYEHCVGECEIVDPSKADSGGCSTMSSPSWLVLLALGMFLRRRVSK